MEKEYLSLEEYKKYICKSVQEMKEKFRDAVQENITLRLDFTTGVRSEWSNILSILRKQAIRHMLPLKELDLEKSITF